MPLAEFQNDRGAVKPGDKLQVTIKSRGPEGYYLLTRSKAARPTDWATLERAFADKTTIVGTVAEHQPGDMVSGRVVEVSGVSAQAELGEGILAACRISPKPEATKDNAGARTDLASLSSMLAARWKTRTTADFRNRTKSSRVRFASFASRS